MKFNHSFVYEGFNVYADHPVIYQGLSVDPKDISLSIAHAEQACELLNKHLPQLGQHPTLHSSKRPLLLRLTEGDATTLAQLVCRMAICLQQLVDIPVDWGICEPIAGHQGQFHLVLAYEEAEVGRQAIHLAANIVQIAIRPNTVSSKQPMLAKIINDFVEYAQKARLDQSTRALLNEADKRGIPWYRISPHARFVQLGQGVFQKRLHETVTTGVEALGQKMSNNKMVATRMLADVGLPVPRQWAVRSIEEAQRIVGKTGYPIVVKPSHGSKGSGITVGVKDDQQLETALMRAAAEKSAVLIEQLLLGDDYRALVVDGKLIAVAKRSPAHVTGDGRHTIDELVSKTNQHPDRGEFYLHRLQKIILDKRSDQLLKEQSMTRQSVPAADKVIMLHATSNLSTGGISEDVTDRVHPTNRAMFEMAARVSNLMIAGIDFITTDISLPYPQTGGGICEVNSSPGLRPHWTGEQPWRDVTGPIIDLLFKPGENGRIPTAAITGTNGKTTTSRMLAAILKQAGLKVGLACSDGVYVGDQRVRRGDEAGPKGARMLLRNPDVEVGVFEVARRGMIERGLGFDHCDVAALLNIREDHLGQYGVTTLEQMAQAKKTLLKSAVKTVILNADDPLCLRMADDLGGKSVILVSTSEDNPEVTRHIEAGHCAVMLSTKDEAPWITICQGAAKRTIIEARKIPATLEGVARHNIDNAMFATALAHAMQLDDAVIREALLRFDCSIEKTPGRLNRFVGLPYDVVLDHGVNPDAVSTIGKMADQWSVTGKKIVLLTAPSDRLNDHLKKVGSAASDHFDQFVLSNFFNLRNASETFVPNLIKQGLLNSGIQEQQIHLQPDPEKAMDSAFKLAQPGDLLIILGDMSERRWRYIDNYCKGRYRQGYRKD